MNRAYIYLFIQARTGQTSVAYANQLVSYLRQAAMSLERDPVDANQSSKPPKDLDVLAGEDGHMVGHASVQ